MTKKNLYAAWGILEKVADIYPLFESKIGFYVIFSLTLATNSASSIIKEMDISTSAVSHDLKYSLSLSL